MTNPQKPNAYAGNVVSDKTNMGEPLTPQHLEFNAKHKGTLKWVAPGVLLVHLNDGDALLTAHQFRQCLLWNEAVNNPDFDGTVYGRGPIGIAELGAACNRYDNKSWSFASVDESGGIVFAEQYVPTVHDGLCSDDIMAGRDAPGMITITVAEYEEGREAIIGRDRAIRKARERRLAERDIPASTEDYATGVNGGAMIAKRRQRIEEARANRLAAGGAVSHIVEIKCSLNTETAARANQRAEEDIIKLGGNPKTGKTTELKVEYAGAAKIVLLLIVDDVIPATIPWDTIQDENRLRLFQPSEDTIRYSLSPSNTHLEHFILYIFNTILPATVCAESSERQLSDER
ncbi:unnamed protein product, partial [Mycena citricolor]